MRSITALFVTLIALGSQAGAQIATGGSYTIEQGFVANGGGSSNGTIYKVEGTSGQPAAGVISSGGLYRAKGGFWQANPLIATGNASISGRVVLEGARGVTNARVTLSGGNLTTPRVVITGRRGTFAFEDVEAGRTYILTVVSRRYGFEQPSHVISVMDNVTDIIFQAIWQN